MQIKPRKNCVVVEKEITQEKKSKSGLLIVSSSMFDDFNKNKEDSVHGYVRQVGEDCAYLKAGDRVVWGKGMHTQYYEEGGKEYIIFKEEKFINARCNPDGTYDVHPEKVLIKITAEEREKLFKKRIKREDGSECDLFLTVEADKDNDRRSTIFVQTGIIMRVGSKIKNVYEGDTAILNYTTDNNDTIIVGYDNGNKMVVIDGNTTYHDRDEIVFANRRTPKNTIVSKRGDYDNISPLLGVIRNEEIIARMPYVFLSHEKNVIAKVSGAGILYEETQEIYERKVVSISEESMKKYHVKNGDVVMVKDTDTFNIGVGNKTLTAVDDRDIMCCMKFTPKLSVV
jgi:co-chaperonin GroES (HSP10)